MQITLSPQSWSRFGEFDDPLSFLEALDEEGADGSIPSCYYLGWRSDSAMQYNDAAEALKGLMAHLDAPSREHVAAGYGRLIAETGHVDEFGMAEATENYWIAASAETTAKLLQHILAVEDRVLLETLRAHPQAVVGSTAEEVEQALSIMLEQHRRIVAEAVSRGVGLLGHCG